MTDTIWLVSQGDYSDYRIVLAFNDEDAATAHVEEWNELGGEERGVSGYEVSSEPPPLRLLYSAGWSNNVPDRRRNIREVWTNKTVTTPEDPLGTLDTLTVYDYTNGTVAFLCQSFDPQRATKIVAGARAKHLAQEAGL